MPSDAAEAPFKKMVRHVLQLLETTRELGNHYTLIDAGRHAATALPIFILSESGRANLDTFPAYTGHTAYSDRANVRLEPDAEHDTIRLGMWQDLEIDVLTPEAREAYRGKFAASRNQKDGTKTMTSSVEELFSDSYEQFYEPGDDLLQSFTTLVRRASDD